MSSRVDSARAGDVDRNTELGQYVRRQPVEIPGVGLRSFGKAGVDERSDNSPNDIGDAVLLFVASEQLAPHAVDGLPLLVHHVVVFEQVFTSGEVLRFDGFLRRSDTARNQLRLDRHIFFHAEPEHQSLNSFAAEDTEQVVLEGQEES